MRNLRRFCPSGTSSSRLLEWSPLSGRLVGTSRCQGPPLFRGVGVQLPVELTVYNSTKTGVWKHNSNHLCQRTKCSCYINEALKLWGIRRMPRYIFTPKKFFCVTCWYFSERLPLFLSRNNLVFENWSMQLCNSIHGIHLNEKQKDFLNIYLKSYSYNVCCVYSI